MFRNILQREGKGSAAAGLGEKDQTQDNMREQFWKDRKHNVIGPTTNLRTRKDARAILDRYKPEKSKSFAAGNHESSRGGRGGGWGWLKD